MSPIGMSVDIVLWDCGTATEETKVANCVSTTEYLAGHSYSGPVRPINYNEATPHGRGGKLTNFTNAVINDFHFNYGRLRSINMTFENGHQYVGSLDNKLHWKNGVYETSEYILDGDFKPFAGNLNVIKTGEVVVKKSGTTFKGSFSHNDNGQWIPDKGEVKYLYKGCEMRVKGDFTLRTAEAKYPFALEQYGEFTIFHPLASINIYNGISLKRASIKFHDNVDGVDIKLKEPQFYYQKGEFISFDSTEEIFSRDSNTNEISLSNFEWSNPFECDSSPIYTNKKIVLPGSSERMFYSNTLKMKHLEDLGFIQSSNNNIEMQDGQLFILNLVNGQSSREIISKKNELSKYVSGQRERYNPEYDVATARVNQASARLARAQAEAAAQKPTENCANNIGACFLLEALKAAPTASARSEYEEALNNLRNTPTTIIDDVYSEYNIEKLKIEASKKQTLSAILIDFKENNIHKASYSLDDSREFTVINSEIAPTDINKVRLTNGTRTEKEVDSWMKKNIKITQNFKDILIELVDTKPQAMSRNAILSFAQNQVDLPTFSSTKTKYDFNQNNTKLTKDYIIEDSILVVDTLDGMGTGFYVTTNLIITNQHVVEDSEFVNLKTFDERTFTGRVIDTDIATDLALIKVDLQGKPLSIESNCSVRRREEVFTVGHPIGYTYSTTRGIVSSVRIMPNPFYSAVGSKKYIQIDAAISSGNSGGPLFNKNEKVIGVNTWGQAGGQSLNFAVHCSELKKFMNSNNINL